MSRVLVLAFMLNFSLVSADFGENTYSLPPLINAILADDYDTAKAIVSSRDYQSAYFGGTPELFFVIIPTCRPQLLTLLLENGANPNSREIGTETTPILEALARIFHPALEWRARQPNSVRFAERTPACCLFIDQSA